MTFNVTHRHAILLKFGDTFLTSVAKLVLAAKASNSSSIKKKKNILLSIFGDCYRFHSLTYINIKVCITNKASCTRNH